MAQQAAKGGQGNMSPSAGDVEYANLAMKLNQNGLGSRHDQFGHRVG
jgi:hypothetical protein